MAPPLHTRRPSTRQRVLQFLVPLLALGGGLLLWQWIVTANQIPRYILPSPVDTAVALVTDGATLWPALLVTLRITFAALAVALAGGVLIAIIFVLSKWL